ncbi:E3 ubiquitin-protein ligase TRIM56 [Holothuria leucospilota]|uniref:E3 ubiquitin-protein ligase TRIM56 n=1 Tax=Holothuria leucospilota TaxID=206669 RepID=A0A9Q1CG32_HOLLE|nr:E3 ubiquitin-protein ligase TRIM56 [Holothuria leucospilota]
MASSGSSHLEDIDEKFCQCSICLQQYKEPKQLPCLHRYCSDCLKQLIERNQGVTVISCPECRDEVTIPTEGVDGFKTDFYMKNIIEYIQLQKSLDDEKLRDCYGCSKRLSVTSYCFKCTGFLCKGCYEYHMISRSLKEHKQHVLSLEDLKSKHMTLEELADLKEAPRCQSHLNDLCLLCCRTCNELPICVACVHGRHKNHDINDVEIVATEEREKLKNEIKNINQYKERMLQMPHEVERVREHVISNFRERKENLTTRYERDMQNMKREGEKTEEDYKRSLTEIENNEERKFTETKKQMEEEIKQIKIKYDNMFDEMKKNSRFQLDNLKKEKEGKVENSREKVKILEREFKNSMDTFTKEQDERLEKLEEISQQIDGIIGRYKNLAATAHSVLETRNDWTAVQCIPDICKAMEPLTRDMKREFPELDKLSRIGVTFEFEEDEESPVTFEGIKADGWRIESITGFSDGSIVITGRTPANYKSHISIFYMNGKVQRRMELSGTHQYAFRFCAYLSEFKIATISWKDEVGVYDIRDYSYIKKNISDVISNWPSDRPVICVTTDPVNNYILVGGSDSRNVYVFDDQLNYHHTLTLPEMIKYASDMAFIGDKLLICDLINKRAYVVTMKGQQGKVTHELTKPDCDGDDWCPLSVCTDSNGLIYILWMTGNSFEAGRRVIVQYTQDGSQSLTRNKMDSNHARCIATVNTNITEKLLVASWNSGKLHIYTIT